MGYRLFTTLSVFVLIALIGVVPVMGQSSTSIPRTSWGDPDLGGAWTNATMTPLQRPADLADQEFLTNEELALRQEEVAERGSLDNRPRTETGAYNEFWMERGSLNPRTSLVINPPNGRLPSLTVPEQQRQSHRTDSYIATRFDSWLDFNKLDRCITRGMPGAMMPGFYNHNYQIVQTENYIVILVEMIHDARIIQLGGQSGHSSKVGQWLGDSRAHWDGDTLVVETSNYNAHGTIGTNIASRGLRGIKNSEALKIVERFTVVDADTLTYEVTVNEPEPFTAPWKVETVSYTHLTLPTILLV